VIKLAVMAEVKTQFRPEFINRIDEIVVFHALDERHIKPRSRRSSSRYLEQRLAKLEMKLEVSDAALAELARAGFDPVYGARPLKRAIQSAHRESAGEADPRRQVRGQGRPQADQRCA
jgi:ATP-dependent Clp protease ATP-binding subunit ClpB